MTFIEKFGWLFQFQKFVSIPNYSESGNVTKVLLAIRRIILVLALCQALHDIITILYVQNFRPIKLSKEISIMFKLLTNISFLANRCGFIFLILYSVLSNKYHLQLISTVLNFENRICCFIKINNHENILKRNFINIETVSVILYIVIFTSLYYVFGSVDHDIKSIISHSFFTIILTCDALTILYCVNFLKRMTFFANILLNDNYDQRKYLLYMKLVFEYFKIIPLINSSLCGMIFVIIFKQIFMGCLTLYHNLLLFQYQHLALGEMYDIVFVFMWKFQYIIYIILLSLAGNKLTDKIQNLLRKQNSMNCIHYDKSRKFQNNCNKQQFLLWRFHIKTKIVVGSTEINNSGIFSMFSFIITCLIIILQFGQAEDDILTPGM
uniref:Uncharacterized protein n=1 Tax=Phlebotomus papatasi TaxID=29031 RepID=A0A3F2ZEJ6_PHLPP